MELFFGGNDEFQFLILSPLELHARVWEHFFLILVKKIFILQQLPD